MHALATVLALVASACAYSVTQPNGVNGWTNSGAQTVVWSRVSTDPTNFTIVLTNQNRAIFPQDQVLVAEQDGVGQTQTSVNPPSGGWPVGSSFRVNLVKSVDEQNTIYAQSDEFTIKAASGSSSALSGSSNALSTSRPTGTTVSPVVTTSNSRAPSPSATNSAAGNAEPPRPNGAAAIKAGTGLMALLGAITYLAA